MWSADGVALRAAAVMFFIDKGLFLVNSCDVWTFLRFRPLHNSEQMPSGNGGTG